MIRLGKIELRKLTNSTYDYEFVKWEKNPRYGQKERYLKDGYVEEGDFLVKNNISITKRLFDTIETCYVVAWLKKDTEGFYMETVGSRLVELKKKHRDDLFVVYKIFTKHLS